MINLDQNAYKKAYIKAIAKLISDRCKTDPYLTDAVGKSAKSLDDIFKYVESQAKKRATGNCAVLTDTEVLEMAVHFIMDGDDAPAPEPVKEEVVEETPAPKEWKYRKPKKALSEEISDQLAFDF